MGINNEWQGCLGAARLSGQVGRCRAGDQHIGAMRAGMFIGLKPLTAVICGALLLGEPLTPIMCLGGGLILVGIYLCNRMAARLPSRK